MFGSTHSGFRRYMTTTIAAGVLASTAAGLALATAGAASADETTVSQLVNVPGENGRTPTGTTPAMSCPGSFPYLVKRQYTNTAAIVPAGVEVVFQGGVVVTITETKFGEVGRGGRWAIGVGSGTTVNLAPDPVVVTLILHCTSEPLDGTPAPR